MGKADSTGRAAISSESQHIASCIADRLGLAAAPTFAMMALLSGALDIGLPDVLCSATQHPPQLNGVVVMYADERFPFGALGDVDRQSANRYHGARPSRRSRRLRLRRVAWLASEVHAWIDSRPRTVC